MFLYSDDKSPLLNKSYKFTNKTRIKNGKVQILAHVHSWDVRIDPNIDEPVTICSNGERWVDAHEIPGDDLNDI